eukprot:TRINITY_DN4065_c0_g1_i1.p1 TRINITY_DN4065_c0_g1~~TRINITY_DN4065_c0_g1_i1.p1  ORF type:complete len:69 (-),score=7.07 TRINITY_DN4065_c0_g1_i1:154-360(-)
MCRKLGYIEFTLDRKSWKRFISGPLSNASSKQTDSSLSQSGCSSQLQGGGGSSSTSGISKVLRVTFSH